MKKLCVILLTLSLLVGCVATPGASETSLPPDASSASAPEPPNSSESETVPNMLDIPDAEYDPSAQWQWVGPIRSYADMKTRCYMLSYTKSGEALFYLYRLPEGYEQGDPRVYRLATYNMQTGEYEALYEYEHKDGETPIFILANERFSFDNASGTGLIYNTDGTQTAFQLPPSIYGLYVDDELRRGAWYSDNLYVSDLLTGELLWSKADHPELEDYGFAEAVFVGDTYLLIWGTLRSAYYVRYAALVDMSGQTPTQFFDAQQICAFKGGALLHITSKYGDEREVIKTVRSIDGQIELAAHELPIDWRFTGMDPYVSSRWCPYFVFGIKGTGAQIITDTDFNPIYVYSVANLPQSNMLMLAPDGRYLVSTAGGIMDVREKTLLQLDLDEIYDSLEPAQ